MPSMKPISFYSVSKQATIDFSPISVNWTGAILLFPFLCMLI